MSRLLEEIVAHKRAEVAEAQQRLPLEELQRRLTHHQRERDFTAALRRQGRLSLIAELKRQSPSAGMLRERFDPISIAQTYESSGAAALSVLTDTRYFGGQLHFLRDIRDFTEIPLLRKEFIIDEYQIYESAWAGADAVLLIVRLLSPETLRRFVAVAAAAQLDALVEVHSEPELEAALAAGAQLIGMNHRDLDTLQVDLTLSERLAPRIPKDHTLVAESGLHTRADLECLRALGVHAVLIGEAFMTAPDIAAKVRELMG